MCSFLFCISVESFAQRASELGIYRPLNILWGHHFVNKSESEFEKVFNKLKQEAPDQIRMRFVAVQLILQKDEEGLKQLANLANSISDDNRLAVNDILVDFYAKESRYEDALRVLETANITVSQLSESTQKKLKKHLSENDCNLPGENTN